MVCLANGLVMKVLISVLASSCLFVPAEAASARPNFVFLLTDDQSTWSLGCYGNPDVKTPHIDRLGAEGIVFDNHYVTTAICMASRGSIMTGRFEFRTGCNFDHGPLTHEMWRKSYPVLLRQAGYRTAIAGKIGFEVSQTEGGEGRLPSGDFDAWGAGPGQTHYATAKNKSMTRYAEDYPHSTLAYGAFGRDFIAGSAVDDRPFCLSISFKAPHKPATPDPRFDGVYRGTTFRKPANFGREHGRHFAAQSRQGRQYERFHSWNYSDRYDEVMATYHQQIHAVDVAVGMIRDALAEHGLAENTVVIFTSDNGFFCGAHGYGSKVLPYEEASRVPMIMLDPRHPNSGRKLRCKALTGNVDFAPTMLRLAGLNPPEGMDGRSLMPLYDEPSAAIHDHLPLINVWGPAEVHSLAVVTRDAKFIYWPWADGNFVATEELYLTGRDPMELKNEVANPEQAATLKEMRRRYDGVTDLWKREAVTFNDYQRFGRLFDRGLSWQEKSGALKRSGKR